MRVLPLKPVIKVDWSVGCTYRVRGGTLKTQQHGISQVPAWYNLFPVSDINKRHQIASRGMKTIFCCSGPKATANRITDKNRLVDAALSKLNLDYLIGIKLYIHRSLTHSLTHLQLTDSLSLTSIHPSINTTAFFSTHQNQPCLPQSSSSATPRPSTTKPISTPFDVK